MDKRIINKQIVIENYSTKNSAIYDNDTNKNFLYGEATKKFIKNIKISDKDKIIADIGCGTGLSGEAFISEGFYNIDGTDFSNEMLEIATYCVRNWFNFSFKILLGFIKVL